MSDAITQDTSSADLGTQNTVIHGVVGHTATTTVKTSRDLADDDKKRRRRRDDPLYITDEASLNSALRHYRSLPASEQPAAMGRIVNRARQLKLARLLPREWGVTQEDDRLVAVLTMETAGEAICLEEAPAGAATGVMRLRAPFYIGDSIARAKGFKAPILFPASILQEIVDDGNRRISEGNSIPLTVYARHAHAISSEEMPIGRIVQLEHDGRVGRATIEIVDDGRYGTQTQRLIQANMLNAVSLRSEEFQLEEAKVNGELVLEAKNLRLAGIDFAPDGPAQPTYGIEVLAAEAVIERGITTSSTEEDIPTDEEESISMELTLEKVRAEAPTIVQEIERPFRDQVATLTAERDAAIGERDKERATRIELEKARDKAEADAEVATLAAQFPKPDEALKVLQDACKDCGNAAEVRATATPILLDALKAVATTAPVTAEKTSGQVLAGLFGQPSGQQITQELTTDQDVEEYDGLRVPA